MKKIMEIIKKKGIDKGIQDAVNKFGTVMGADISQDDIDSGVKSILLLELLRNDELSEAVFEVMFDKVIDEIVDELNITYQPDPEEPVDDLCENLEKRISQVRMVLLKSLS